MIGSSNLFVSNAAQRGRDRTGLTLVEMLVVVALTVLLMSIIAEVFVLASETLTSLREISDANQKIRTVQTTIRQDLLNRTIRQVQPPMEKRIHPGPDGVFGTGDDYEYLVPIGFDPADNMGYFSIEENSPADEQSEDVDDVIAFTVRLPQRSGVAVGGIGSAYYGRAIVGSEPDVAFAPIIDGLAGSLEAEVVYFLRRGTLYRRVLLVAVAQPSDTAAFNPSKFATPESWYARYDISARPGVASPPTPVPTALPWPIPIVNKLGDLTYRSARYAHRPPAAYWSGNPGLVPPLPPGAGLAADNAADPYFPFLAIDFAPSGRPYHDATTPTDPLDHNHNYPGMSLSVPVTWFGRPTLKETCDPNWDSPMAIAAGPTGRVFPVGGVPADPTLFNSARPREDALMTNVLSFDVKVWDPDAQPVPGAAASGAFVDLGKNFPAGSASASVPGPIPSAGSPGVPMVYPWPPRRGIPRGFGAPWPGDPGPDGMFGTADDAVLAAWKGPNNVDEGGGGDDGLWRRLLHTYDTWCTAYSKPAHVGMKPVGPPYIAPVRGIQIKIRFVDPETRHTRETTIVQELQ